MPASCVVMAMLIGGMANGAYPPQEVTKAQIAKKVKLSTCLVETDGSFRQGSAFCVHESGLFLTNEHVVGKATTVNLVLNPGQRDQKSMRLRSSEPTRILIWHCSRPGKPARSPRCL